MPVIRPAEGQDVGELARHLLAIAEAEGLDLPTTTTDGPSLGFVVSDDLFASYQGEPAKGVKDESDAGTKSARGRKKKGDS